VDARGRPTKLRKDKNVEIYKSQAGRDAALWIRAAGKYQTLYETLDEADDCEDFTQHGLVTAIVDKILDCSAPASTFEEMFPFVVELAGMLANFAIMSMMSMGNLAAESETQRSETAQVDVVSDTVLGEDPHRWLKSPPLQGDAW
jgi:hypothetical protein